MNDAADREPSHARSVADYLVALQGYLRDPGEASLQNAYEIGRAALGAGTSLITIAQAHHESLQELLSQANATDAPRLQIVIAASQFFAECIAPYEMTYGGYREANVALRHFNEVLEQEARRIARALHDEAGQLLVAVYIALQELGREIPSARLHVPRMTQLLDQIEGQLRRIAHELAPALLSDLGLVPALRYLTEGLAQRSQLHISVEDLPGPRLPRPVEGTLYRVAKEALNNVLKHAQATAVTIRFDRSAHAVCCFIRDDGVGFDASAGPAPGGEHGFGLIGIRERLNMVHGHLQIESSRKSGTELIILVPVES